MADDPELDKIAHSMLGIVPLVIAKRAGGELRIPAAEMEDINGWALDLVLDGGDFVFTATKKQ